VRPGRPSERELIPSDGSESLNSNLIALFLSFTYLPSSARAVSSRQIVICSNAASIVPFGMNPHQTQDVLWRENLPPFGEHGAVMDENEAADVNRDKASGKTGGDTIYSRIAAALERVAKADGRALDVIKLALVTVVLFTLVYVVETRSVIALLSAPTFGNPG
jgi:hypothetical protein